MGIVRDVVTCTCLAAVGLYVPAVLGAAAGPALTALAGVAGGVAGNLGFKIHEAIDRGAAAKITRGWRGIDENHVVVQALRAAYLDALRAVVETYRATARATPDRRDHETFADAVEAFANSEWTEAERLNFVRQGSLTNAEFDIRQQILKDLPAAFGAALSTRQASAAELTPQQAFAALRDALVRGALAEIESRTLPEGSRAPDLFRAVFEGVNLPDSWFDLFIRSAAVRLKTKEDFEAIWNAEQVARVKTVVEDVQRRLTRVQTMLQIPLDLGTATDAQLARIVQQRPTDLLLARFRVVPFLDHHGALENVLSWARDPRIKGAAGRLYVAPGGYGKTRMAIELILALESEGWDCTFLSPATEHGQTPGGLTDLMAGEDREGVLLVLDYAESQIELLKLVMRAAASVTVSHPIRIVALARSAEG